MTPISIKYKNGYKYQLQEWVLFQHPLLEGLTNTHINTEFIELHDNGTLCIRAGYAWDGASGPCKDTPDILTGSLVHDALYQLMREREIPPDSKSAADKLFREINRANGMSKFRAWYTYHAVRHFADKATYASSRKPILEAP